MEDPFFRFDDPDTEIGRKIESRRASPARLMDRLAREEAVRRLDADDQERLGALSDLLLRLPFDQVYPNYLNHPIRVTAAYLTHRPDPSYDDAALALCHNAKEAGLAEDIACAGLLPDNVGRRIALLTIDRDRERDPDYLDAYYDAIRDEGPDLMLLKALDKLDNALEWPLDDLPSWHGRVVLDHVVPRTHPGHPEVARYLRELVPYVARPDVKERFRATEREGTNVPDERQEEGAT